jgi:hypothetical protein
MKYRELLDASWERSSGVFYSNAAHRNRSIREPLGNMHEKAVLELVSDRRCFHVQ